MEIFTEIYSFRLLLVESSVIVQRIFKNMMNNYAWALIIWWKRKIFTYFIKCYWILKDVFSFKIYFSFSFCSDFNLEATVVKTDEIRGLKNNFEILQLWAKFQTAMVLCSRFIWITNSGDHRKVWIWGFGHWNLWSK